MPSKFLESVSSKLAEAWVAQVLSPAFAFWLVGLAALAWSRGWDDLQDQVDDWVANREPGYFLAVAIVGLVVVGISGSLATRLALPILRLLEGYWPSPLAPVARALRSRQLAIRTDLESEWQTLSLAVDDGPASRSQRDRYVDLDEQLRRFPSGGDVMPTRLGNILRASETRPRDRYGLEPTRCWIHLWLLLPDSQRSELQTARTDLDAAATTWAWSLGISVWVIWAWWAPLVAIGFVLLVHQALLLPAARTWADEVEAVVDLYRHDLYRALRLALPSTPAEDREAGEFVNEYLLRGSDRSDVTLVSDKSEK